MEVRGWIHSIIYIGQCPPTTSSLQPQDHKPLFSVCCTSLVRASPTLLVPCESAASSSSSPSSSPSSCSDPGPVVDISRSVYYCRLKTPLISVCPSITTYPLLGLISWNLTIRCLTVTGGGDVGECGRLSQLGWDFGRTIKYLYLLTYLLLKRTEVVKMSVQHNKDSVTIMTVAA